MGFTQLCSFLYFSEEYLLDDVKTYRFLTHQNTPVPGIDDDDLYRQLIEAFDIMGVSKDEVACKCTQMIFIRFSVKKQYHSNGLLCLSIISPLVTSRSSVFLFAVKGFHFVLKWTNL